VHVFLSQVSIADVIADRLTPCPAVPDFASMMEADAPAEEAPA
jgi:Rrf2 family iron-sulfur cluster assembly transcriptional regulator